MRDLLERYIEVVGHEPSEAPAQYAWQWDYRGQSSERELLLDLIQNEAEEEAEQLRLC